MWSVLLAYLVLVCEDVCVHTVLDVCVHTHGCWDTL